MSYTHPHQFAFQRYEYAARDRYHDYYGIVLRERMGGFAPGTRFEAGSVRGDGAIHARSNGRVYFLGRMSLEDEQGISSDDDSFGSDMGADGADQAEQSGLMSQSFYSAPDSSYSGNRWSFSSTPRGRYEARSNGSKSSYGGNRWSFSSTPSSSYGNRYEARSSGSYGGNRGSSCSAPGGSYSIRYEARPSGSKSSYGRNRWSFSLEDGGQNMITGSTNDETDFAQGSMMSGAGIQAPVYAARRYSCGTKRCGAY